MLLIALTGTEGVRRSFVVTIVLVDHLAGAGSHIPDSNVDVFAVGGSHQVAICAEHSPEMPLVAPPAGG